MSDKTRAARERYRAWKSLKTDDVQESYSGGAVQHWEDEELMITENLAEHPADDGEPATFEWVSSLPGAVSREHYVVFHVHRGNGFRVQFSFDQDGGYTIQIGLTVIYDGLPQCRRDVRRLLTALGVEQ